MTQLLVDLKTLQFEYQTDLMKQLRECIVDSLKKRFKFVEKQRYYTFASLIDPSINLKLISSKLIFKYWLFQGVKATSFTSEDDKNQAINLLTEEILSYVKNKNPKRLEIQKEFERPAKKRRGLFEFIQECENIQREGSEDTSSAQIELDIFLKEKVVGKVDAFEWWDQNKFRFPNIFHFVKKYLIVPATSVPAERVFSKAGEIISSKRNRLSRKRANELIFLNINKRLCR